MSEITGTLARFQSLERFFHFIVEEKIPIFMKAEDGKGYYTYMDPKTIDELKKDSDRKQAAKELPTILADMFYNCRIEIRIKDVKKA